MRRKDREITDRKEIESIIARASVCRLAMVNENKPYMVPLCFGYRENTLYFHSAHKGKKLDILRKNNQVCFEIESGCEPVKGKKACDWGMKFQSVIGFGKAIFLTDLKSKLEALETIMANYSDGHFQFSESDVKKTSLFKVEISEMRGKEAP